jgi:hypothetical protein
MARRQRTVLVLQGGGALGACQADVYEGIAETGVALSWIAGVSIRAIDVALIGGNPPGVACSVYTNFGTGFRRTASDRRVKPCRSKAWVSCHGLYAFFTPLPGYYAPLLPVALYRCRYRFDERTNVDLLHSWSLLRFLFVFLLACPFLIIPVLLGLFKKQPDTEDRTEAPAERGTRVEVSGRGTWNAQADGRSQSSKPDGALAPIERRAA